jgi:hypothetical protein
VEKIWLSDRPVVVLISGAVRTTLFVERMVVPLYFHLFNSLAIRCQFTVDFRQDLHLINSTRDLLLEVRTIVVIDIMPRLEVTAGLNIPLEKIPGRSQQPCLL